MIYKGTALRKTVVKNILIKIRNKWLKFLGRPEPELTKFQKSLRWFCAARNVRKVVDKK